jgi:hypothetical protein
VAETLAAYHARETVCQELIRPPPMIFDFVDARSIFTGVELTHVGERT